MNLEADAGSLGSGALCSLYDRGRTDLPGATFESFLAGLAPPPEQAQLDELSRLQKLEHHLLLRTLDHVRRKANGLPTAPGALE